MLYEPIGGIPSNVGAAPIAAATGPEQVQGLA
jgi:hypothetical protein